MFAVPNLIFGSPQSLGDQRGVLPHSLIYHMGDMGGGPNMVGNSW